MPASLPTFDDVRGAARRIADHVKRTPVLTSRQVNARTGAEVFFKCENFQRVGAFKFRGALNAVLSLDDETAERGVVTHSSGNHAQALALAARLRGICATIVMPRNAPAVKRAAVIDYGAEVVACEPTLAAREQTAAECVARTGGTLIHPFNDARIIAGQGTAALELIEDAGALDALITPIGGGGLLSGTCLTAAALLPSAAVFGAEPSADDDARRSLAAGRIISASNAPTIADGLRTSLGELTFAVIRSHVRDILVIDDDATAAAMRFVWERMKIVIEPSAAVPVAALFAAGDRFAGQRVGVVLSGGNVDLDCLPWRPQSGAD